MSNLYASKNDIDNEEIEENTTQQIFEETVTTLKKDVAVLGARDDPFHLVRVIAYKVNQGSGNRKNWMDSGHTQRAYTI